MRRAPACPVLLPDLGTPEKHDAVSIFAALVEAVDRGDYRAATRRTRELSRLGWSVLPRTRKEVRP